MKSCCSLVVFVLFVTGYCTADPVSFYKPYGSHLIFTPESQQSSALCEVCVVLIQKLDFYVQTNETEQMINTTLYQICDHFDGNLRIQCYAAIPWVEEHVKGGFDPQAACTKLMLCMDSKSVGQVSQKQRQRLPAGNSQEDDARKERFDNSEECTICKLFVSQIEKIAYQEKDVILTYIENLCHELPPPVDQDCLNSLASDFPLWWDDFFQYIISPDNLCTLLELCSS